MIIPLAFRFIGYLTSLGSLVFVDVYETRDHAPISFERKEDIVRFALKCKEDDGMNDGERMEAFRVAKRRWIAVLA